MVTRHPDLAYAPASGKGRGWIFYEAPVDLAVGWCLVVMEEQGKPVEVEQERAETLYDSHTRETYSSHRETRSNQQRDRLMMEGTVPDPRLIPIVENGEPDERHGIVTVARPRPGEPLTALIQSIQQRIGSLPGVDLWQAPVNFLHMTIVELAHTSPPAQIEAMVSQLRSADGPRKLTRVPGFDLDTPLITFDQGGIALSLLPVDDGVIRAKTAVHNLIVSLGVAIKPRYRVPSCHITIARFTTPLDPGSIAVLLETITALNSELSSSDVAWHASDFEFSYGANWYGNGIKLA